MLVEGSGQEFWALRLSLPIDVGTESSYVSCPRSQSSQVRSASVLTAPVGSTASNTFWSLAAKAVLWGDPLQWRRPEARNN